VGSISAISSVYRTEPVGYREQPDFWNLVLELETGLGPEELLREALRIEEALGRVRTFRNAPRPIDIDLLFYDDLVLESPHLRLPHPRAMERGFVLFPLAEIAPQLRDPRTGERIVDRLERAEGLERVERLFPGERLLGEEDG